MKKAISLLMAAVMSAAVLSGCKKDDENSRLDETREKIYVAQELTLPEERITNARFTDSGIILNGESGISLMDYEDGSVKELIPLNSEKGGGTDYSVSVEGTTASLGTEGNVIADCGTDGIYYALETVYEENSSTVSGFTIRSYDKDGKLLDTMEIDPSFFGKNEEYAFIMDFMQSEGYFYILSYGMLYILDSSGNYLFEHSPNPNGNGVNQMISLVRLKDGRVAAASWGMEYDTSERFVTVSVADPGSKSAEDFRLSTPEIAQDYTFGTGMENDIIVCTSAGIYDCDLETGTKKGIFNTLDYGIDTSELAGVKALPDGSVLTSFAPMMGELVGITKFIPTDPADLPEGTIRERVTMAALNIDNWLKKYIADFNKSNPDYLIELKSYMEEGLDKESALQKFSLDLTSGNIPDLILVDRMMPSQSYINKGIFADINTLIENDPDFNRDDYLPNVFSSLEQEDGKLYEVFTMFSILTLMTKSSETGDSAGWSFEEFEEYVSSKPDSLYIIDQMTKEIFISYMVQFMFIDPKTGACSFDMEAFGKILELSERFPDNPPEINDGLTFIQGVAEGDPIMLLGDINQFRSIKENEAFAFGEPLTFKGMPGVKGNGAFFNPIGKFAVSEASDNKDGAWSFIKYMFENNISDYNSYMPAKISDIEKMMQEAKEDPYYLDENGEKVPYKNEVYLGIDGGEPQGFTIDNNTDADNEKVMEVIRSTESVLPVNQTVSGIIEEETAAYLDGQKSSDETAKVIEERINLYISEMS